MAIRSFHRAAVPRVLSITTLVIAVCYTIAAAAERRTTAEGNDLRPRGNHVEPRVRPDRIPEFGELHDRVLQLIQATEFQQALELALKALQIAETAFAPNDSRLANIKNSLGLIYKNLNVYDAAEPLFFSARSIWQGNNEKLMVAYADNNIGTLYLDLTRFDDAERHLKSAFEMRQSTLGERHALTAATLHNLALALILKGRFAEGEEKIRQAIQLRGELLGPQDPLTLSSVVILSYCLIQESRFAEADQLLSYLVRTYRHVGLKRQDGYLTALNNSAFVLMRLRSHESAKILLREFAGLQAEKSGTSGLAYSVALTNLGRAEYLSKDYAAARATLERALDIQRAGSGAFQKYAAITANNLGLVFLDSNDVDAALATFREAVATAEKAFDPKNQFFSLVYRNIALALAGKGELVEALEQVRKATSFIPANNASQVLDIEAGFGMSANTYEDLYSAFISISKRLFDDDNAGNRDLVSEAFRASQLASSSRSSAALFLMSARFISDESAVSKLIRTRQDLIGQWHALNRRIISGLSRVSAKPGPHTERQLTEKLSAIWAQIEAIEGQIATLHPKFAEFITPQPLELAEAQRLLREDEALVESHVGTNEISLWFVTRNEVRWATVPLSVAAIADMVKSLRCGLDDQEWRGVQQSLLCTHLLGLTEQPESAQPLPFHFGIAHQLYEALFGPAEDLIRNRHLLIVPSGPLSGLPFHVLASKAADMAIGRKYEDYQSIAWLAKTQAISVLPSVASLRWLRNFAKTSAAPRSYVGFGDPVLRGDPACPKGTAPATCRSPETGAHDAAVRAGRRPSSARSGSLDDIFGAGARPDQVRAQVQALCPLPDTNFEIKCVAQGFGVGGAEIHLGQDATEASLKALSASGALAQYRVVHFATHGLVAGDMETIANRQGEPALVLTPPQMPKEADDDGLLTASEVAQLDLNADWVILSACNTAAAESAGAEALSGLARAFFYAGARALLVSHWPVYSDAAVQLVIGTFKHLQENKVGRAEALRRAMVAFIEDPTARDNGHPSIWAPFVVVGEGAR
jgi:CHAT domain-containing protein/tetratricopeptide (TPR) repeat protein